MSKTAYDRLESLRRSSNCRTLSEFARKVLQEERINWYEVDRDKEVAIHHLALIRRELNAIGININQATCHFHSTHLPEEKIAVGTKLLEEYKRINERVEEILSAIVGLSNKWSQK